QTTSVYIRSHYINTTPQSSLFYSTLRVHPNSFLIIIMYKLLLLIVAVFALVAAISAQIITYPINYAPYYTYPTYGYTYPVTYNPYITLLRR
ncbi:Uncharacterized protein FWK35_00010762, partial [Aphis craccivora]